MTKFAGMIEGYRRFRAEGLGRQRERWEELAKGQAPKVMVVACSDSRVDPATIFDASPGEMFVVRNVANLVPPFELGKGRHGVSAALEFAVTQLEVPEIVVMGHGHCGGCRAALLQNFRDAPPGEGGFIARWISMLDEARAGIAATHADLENPDALREMEHSAVRVSLENLKTFPCMQERMAKGSITLHGAWFALEEGQLYVLNQESGDFEVA